MKWTRAYKNRLPDSAFLYVEPGGTEVAGRTHPLTLRHFPYKDIKGYVNQEHLHNALARLHQEKTGRSWETGLPRGLLGKLYARAQAIYSREFGYARAPKLPPGVTRMPPRAQAMVSFKPGTSAARQKEILKKYRPRVHVRSREKSLTAEHFMPSGVKVRKAR